ncbi:hypothetical protein [Pseudomonas sp. PMCC200344]|nr:hypothetical protein [Pseudomonas sp. PMCC200344]
MCSFYGGMFLLNGKKSKNYKLATGGQQAADPDVSALDIQRASEPIFDCD